MKAKNLMTMLTAAAAAVVLTTACSSDTTDVLAENQESALQAAPVGFSANLNRTTTRAGYAGEMNTGMLQVHGFGVFGYYGDGVLYNQNLVPNFMYNQMVKYDTSENLWKYSPVKYWPNEFGVDAISNGVDRLTFFAYAPYVEVTPSTGVVTGTGDDKSGIVRLSRASDTGDPYVHYVVDFDPAKGVDLCWGVAKQDYTSSVAALGTDGVNNVPAGSPYLDVAKPEIGQRIDYNFKHALAALNLQIDAIVDDGTPDVGQGTEAIAGEAYTKIWVRYVTFEGFSTSGALNLNNPDLGKPYWRSDSRMTYLTTSPVTINDGRLDGYEGTADYEYETPIALNPTIVQGSAYAVSGSTLNTVNGEAGVTKTAVNLLNSGTLTAPIYVIPNNTPMKVTIAYDVETYDPKLKATYLSDGVLNGSSVENIISTTVLTTPMEAGKVYTVKLHLGMNSVKADATVAGWTTEDAGDVELPINKEP